MLDSPPPTAPFPGDLLQPGETLRVTVKGHCMRPLLLHGQQVQAEKRSRYLPGDIVVYAAAGGEWRVHRFLGSVPGRGGWRAMLRADSAASIDALVPQERILGLVAACDGVPVAVPLLTRLRAVGVFGLWFVRLTLRRLFGKRRGAN